MPTVLHLYPADNAAIAAHVNMLQAYSHAEFEAYQAPPSSSADGAEGDQCPDIVHLHGCWHYDLARRALRYHRDGSRIVFSPHGGLSPWQVDEKRLSEKLPKTILWQRRTAESAYVVIARSKIEADSLAALAWNPRIETIRNAVVTSTITPEAMAGQTAEVYRKVMDSNTLELMSDETRQLMSLMLKAGICGDIRWLSPEERELATPYASSTADSGGKQPADAIGEAEWRKLVIYANHENIRTVIDAGARLLGIHQPYIDTAHISSYMPTDYKKPEVSDRDIVGLTSEMRQWLTMRHLVELDRALRRNATDEERVTNALEDHSLLKHFRRLLQLLCEQTRLDEGFLPAQPLNDAQTALLRRKLDTHLRI